MNDDKKTTINQDYALVLLVKEIMSQVDELCALRKQGAKGAISHQLLREMCSVLPELDMALTDRYFEVLVSTASKAEPVREQPLSEEIVAASIQPKRKTLQAITHKLGLRAA